MHWKPMYYSLVLALGKLYGFKVYLFLKKTARDPENISLFYSGSYILQAMLLPMEQSGRLMPFQGTTGCPLSLAFIIES